MKWSLCTCTSPIYCIISVNDDRQVHYHQQTVKSCSLSLKSVPFSIKIQYFFKNLSFITNFMLFEIVENTQINPIKVILILVRSFIRQATYIIRPIYCTAELNVHKY